MLSIERSEPQIETETFHDENGKMIKRTVKRSEVTTTKTVSERIIASTAGQIVHVSSYLSFDFFNCVNKHSNRVKNLMNSL
ncbi:unnamed protein product [Schistosoma mattheei]|uniref:Uncharacterized protein n=1 Tax=Schistosoma mattheei TaxID=31246 RepID=A0A183NLH7_9TREM|nr:unnamed protein product [Schistosoma mattheei]